MHKKLIMACMAIAAFAAFVIAPAASASPVLTDEGKPVPKGTKVTATLTGNAVFTASGGITVTCNKAVLTGEVTKNESNVVEGKILKANAKFTGTGASEDCTSNLFNAAVGVTVNSDLCIKTTGGDSATVTGCGANVSFTLNFTGVATCVYTTASVTGTYVTNSAPFTVSEQPATSTSGGFCPSSGKLDMVFDLWTDGAKHEATNALVVS